jgi:hypothetical protein
LANNVELTATASSDLSVATGLRIVYWLYVRTGGTGGAWSLEDGTDDSGTVKLDGSMAANDKEFFPFVPPLEFKSGIFFDIGGTNTNMTVGYS